MVVFFSVDLPEVQRTSRVWEDQAAQLRAARSRLRVAEGLADSFGEEVSGELTHYLHTWVEQAHQEATAAQHHSEQLADIVSTSVSMDETAASHFRGMMPWSATYAFTDLGSTPPTTPGSDEWYPDLGSSGVPHVQHLDGGAR